MGRVIKDKQAFCSAERAAVTPDVAAAKALLADFPIISGLGSLCLYVYRVSRQKPSPRSALHEFSCCISCAESGGIAPASWLRGGQSLPERDKPEDAGVQGLQVRLHAADGAPLCHLLSLGALGARTRLEKIGSLAMWLLDPRSEQLAQCVQGSLCCRWRLGVSSVPRVLCG